MASTYKAYLGEGLGALGEMLLPLKIPHPGKASLSLKDALSARHVTADVDPIFPR